MLLSKTLWRQVGGYDESMRQVYEDWEFNIRLFAAGARPVLIPEPIFHYRVGAAGMLQSVSRGRHGPLWRDIQRKHPALYRPLRLWRTWWAWRGQPSARPLWQYLPLWLASRLLPRQGFDRLLRRVLTRLVSG